MMNEKTSFRVLKDKDISKVVDLVKSSFASTYLIPSIYRADGIKKFISLELNNKFSNYLYYVLTNEKDIFAFVEFKLFNCDKVAFLNIIAVNNNFKNQGNGNKIINYSTQKLLKSGFNTIQLDVFLSNKIALNWYASKGFTSINKTGFFKISTENKKTSQIKVTNFAQYKTMHQKLGFSMLEISINNQNDRIGVIENDFIIRTDTAYQKRHEIGFLSKKIGIKNIYLLGNYPINENNKLLDTISRMELKIS